MARVRGVRGAAGVCALAAVLYLLARSVLTLLVSGIMGLMQPGASLAHAAGFGEVGVILLQTLVGIGALALLLWWLLCSTRLQVKDMRITIPTAWSPGFCLPVFLGLANAGNLLGGLLCRIFGVEQPGTLLAGGGMELFLQFVSLCLVPAVTEELFFRGALQGLLRPSGSAAAIFGTALLCGSIPQTLESVAYRLSRGRIGKQRESVSLSVYLTWCIFILFCMMHMGTLYAQSDMGTEMLFKWW